MESWDDGSLTIGLVCDEGFVCTPLRDTPDEHVDYALVVPRGVDVPGTGPLGSVRPSGAGCPLVFEPAADPGHKMMRVTLSWGGRIPKRVS
ncbi:hypothetical protein [Planobispora longispora]|uniref:Uncharacterized protein n=1 Tax=Planobispora longispora TaxID=28887 RepID=A0A8J3RU16_9ACTN|nr:hypothetical protein [Planobispora longispora]GIH81143.1 hypothetical protein Plo01_75720 [Planobispora longispora]